MIATVYSTLGGILAGKHPRTGLLVREDGFVKLPRGWSKGHKAGTGRRYYMVSTFFNRVRGSEYVHTLVNETFNENFFGKPTTDHIDRTPENNHRRNLRWATRSEQIDNSALAIDAISRLGFRPKDFRNEANKVHYQEMMKDPNRSAKHRKTRREYARKYKARKKAERSAQPS